MTEKYDAWLRCARCNHTFLQHKPGRGCYWYAFSDSDCTCDCPEFVPPKNDKLEKAVRSRAGGDW